MNYTECYKNAKKEGLTQRVNVELLKLTNDNPLLVGKYLGHEERISDVNNSPYYSHLFLTDTGKVAIAPGVIVDKVLMQPNTINKMFAITFLGKTTSANGRTFNNYLVESFDYAEK